MLQPYDFKIEHQHGKSYGNADVLSQRPRKEECEKTKWHHRSQEVDVCSTA